MLTPLLLLLLLPAPAQAQAPLTDGVSEETTADLRAQLEAIKAVYFGGGHVEAHRALDALAAQCDPSEPEERNTLIEALVYRGEIEFVTDDRAASWDSFSEVLSLDPSYQISTFLHPTEVVDWFSLVQREVAATRDVPPPPPPDPEPAPPPPVWTFAPGGIPQLRQGRTGAGLAFGTAQLATGGASIALHLAMRDWKREIQATGGADDPRIPAFNRLRYGVQIPATVAFYALWAWSVVDGRRTWRRDHPPAVTAFIDPQSRQVVFHARF